METQRLVRLFDFFEKNPNDTFVLFAIAQEYAKIEQYEKAETYFSKLLDTDENYGGAYYHLGKLHENKGDINKAIETYTKGIEINKKLKDHHAVGELQTALSLIDEDAY